MLRAGKRAFAVGIRKVAEMTVNEASQGAWSRGRLRTCLPVPLRRVRLLGFLALCLLLLLVLSDARRKGIIAPRLPATIEIYTRVPLVDVDEDHRSGLQTTKFR